MKQSISAIVFDREDSTTLEGVQQALAGVQAEIVSCASKEALLNTIASSTVDVLVINLEKPFERSFELLFEIQTRSRDTEVIFVAPLDHETLWAWMEVIQRGAHEFLPEPFEPEELRYHLIQATRKHHSLSLRKLPSAGFLKDLNSALLHKTAQAGA